MIYFISGLATGMVVMMILYSSIVAERISALEQENANLLDNIQHLEYDLNKMTYSYRYKDGGFEAVRGVKRSRTE